MLYQCLWRWPTLNYNITYPLFSSTFKFIVLCLISSSSNAIQWYLFSFSSFMSVFISLKRHNPANIIRRTDAALMLGHVRPTLNQHWLSVLCFLGISHRNNVSRAGRNRPSSPNFGTSVATPANTEHSPDAVAMLGFAGTSLWQHWLNALSLFGRFTHLYVCLYICPYVYYHDYKNEIKELLF